MSGITKKGSIATAVVLAAAAVVVALMSRPETGRPAPSNGHELSQIQRGNNARLVASGADAVRASNHEMVGSKAFNIRFAQPDFDGPALDFVRARLAASAAGDSQATYEIFQRVSSCRREIANADDGEFLAYSQAGLGAKYANSMERNLSQCASLGEDPSLASMNWLSLAAEQGSVEARIVYSRVPEEVVGNYQQALRNPERLVEYRDNVVRYLDESASAGSLDAVVSLGNIYARGTLAERDDVKSYAYRLALEQIRPTSVIPEEMTAQKEGLSPSQQAEAAKLARDVLRNCCNR